MEETNPKVNKNNNRATLHNNVESLSNSSSNYERQSQNDDNFATAKSNARDQNFDKYLNDEFIHVDSLRMVNENFGLKDIWWKFDDKTKSEILENMTAKGYIYFEKNKFDFSYFTNDELLLLNFPANFVGKLLSSIDPSVDLSGRSHPSMTMVERSSFFNNAKRFLNATNSKDRNDSDMKSSSSNLTKAVSKKSTESLIDL